MPTQMEHLTQGERQSHAVVPVLLSSNGQTKGTHVGQSANIREDPS